MLSESEKIRLIQYYRDIKTDYQDGLKLILDALTMDVLDQGNRFEHLYISSLSHYGT